MYLYFEELQPVALVFLYFIFGQMSTQSLKVISNEKKDKKLLKALN